MRSTQQQQQQQQPVPDPPCTLLRLLVRAHANANLPPFVDALVHEVDGAGGGFLFGFFGLLLFFRIRVVVVVVVVHVVVLFLLHRRHRFWKVQVAVRFEIVHRNASACPATTATPTKEKEQETVSGVCCVGLKKKIHRPTKKNEPHRSQVPSLGTVVATVRYNCRYNVTYRSKTPARLSAWYRPCRRPVCTSMLRGRCPTRPTQTGRNRA